jgi:hypothetical protein
MELYVGWTSEQKSEDPGYLLYFKSVRNKLLSDCDWTQVFDAPLTEAQRVEWRVYRQALRDLPSTTDIANPEFPQRPDVLLAPQSFAPPS